MRAKLLLLPVFVLLAGCADYTTQWMPEDSPKQIRVDVAHSSYEVRYAPGATALGATETTRLARFVAAGGIQPEDRIAIEQSDSIGKVAQQRRNALLKALRTQGVGAVAWIAAAPKVGRDRIVLKIERAVATAPACPDWSKPPIDYSGQVASNFGCATATNLANMVADPADLMRASQGSGRKPGDLSADAAQAFHDHQGWGAPQTQTPFAQDFSGPETTGGQ